MAFRTLSPLMPGIDVTVQFTLSRPALLVSAECRVCWSNDQGQSGLSFLFLPSNLSSELQAWLARRLEEATP
jgi:hypothetical protein